MGKPAKAKAAEERKTSVYAGEVQENTLDLALQGMATVSVPDIGLCAAR